MAGQLPDCVPAEREGLTTSPIVIGWAHIEAAFGSMVTAFAMVADPSHVIQGGDGPHSNAKLRKPKKRLQPPNPSRVREFRVEAEGPKHSRSQTFHVKGPEVPGV